MEQRVQQLQDQVAALRADVASIDAGVEGWLLAVEYSLKGLMALVKLNADDFGAIRPSR